MGLLARHSPTPTRTPNPPTTPSIRHGTKDYLPEGHHAALENLASQSSAANSSTQLTDTNPTTRQFLRDIALMFSRQKSSQVARSLNSIGPSYVTATMLRQAKKERSLTIYVAFNKDFQTEDRKYGEELVKFLNSLPCSQPNGEEEDVQKLAIMANNHCFGRFSAYVNDVKAQRQDHPDLYTASSKDIDAAQDVVDKQCFGCPTKKSAKLCVQVQLSIESTVQRLGEHDVPDKLKRLCKILRACRRIVRFRNSQSKQLAGKFSIDGIKKSPSHHVHCEMKLVHEFLRGGIYPTFDYIGCTKLPCLPCWFTVKKGSPFTTEKTHWKIYAWDLPSSEPPFTLEKVATELVTWLPGKAKPTGNMKTLCPESPVDWDLCFCFGYGEKGKESGCTAACLLVGSKRCFGEDDS